MEKELFVEVTRRIKVTQEDIDDIMATALEGGITCLWCCKAKVVGDYLGEFASEQISHGGTLKLYDSVEDTTYDLTLENFMHGLKKAIQGGWYANYDWYNDDEIDTCNVDAEVADVIIQLALFDDVIYG